MIQTTKKEITSIIVDTNFLISHREDLYKEYQRSYAENTLQFIVLRPVIRELDRMKSHSYEARHTNNALNFLIENTKLTVHGYELNPACYLVYNYQAFKDGNGQTIRYHSTDEELLEYAKQLRKTYKNQEFIFYTYDTNLRTLAKHNQFQISIPNWLDYESYSPVDIKNGYQSKSDLGHVEYQDRTFRYEIVRHKAFKQDLWPVEKIIHSVNFDFVEYVPTIFLSIKKGSFNSISMRKLEKFLNNLKEKKYTGDARRLSEFKNVVLYTDTVAFKHKETIIYFSDKGPRNTDRLRFLYEDKTVYRYFTKAYLYPTHDSNGEDRWPNMQKYNKAVKQFTVEEIEQAAKKERTKNLLIITITTSVFLTMCCCLLFFPSFINSF
jgi:rRNA-processing protein FCF1